MTRTLFITLLLAFFSQSAVAAVLEKVTNQSLEDGRVVVNLFFNGQSKPEIFFIPGDSPRLVFDFPDTSYKGQQKTAVDSAILRAIRIATHQNPLKTRVVFDLRIGSVDYKQEFLEDGHTLRISLSGKGPTPPAKTAAPPLQVTPPVVAPPPVKKETVAAPPAEPKAKQPAAVLPPAAKETVPPPKAESPVKPPSKPPLATAEKSEQAGLDAAKTAAAPPAEPKAKQPVAVSSPAAKETVPPPKVESPAKPPAEAPPAAPEKSEQAVSGAAKSAASSPFDSPFVPTEATVKPAETAEPAAPAAPAAAQMLDYSLVSRPAGGDVLRLQLDGYANPEITAHEGRQPQLVCFFPKMRLAVKKGTARPSSGKFVRKVAMTAQEKPSGVKVVLDLAGGYDYDIQQIFVKDELAFLLIVNIFSH